MSSQGGRPKTMQKCQWFKCIFAERCTNLQQIYASSNQRKTLQCEIANNLPGMDVARTQFTTKNLHLKATVTK